MKNISFFLVVFLLGLSLFPIRAEAAEANTIDVLANIDGFSVEIPGAASASKNIREVKIDDLNIDAREMTTGLDVEYRLYGPGHAYWGLARFTSACVLGGSKELQAWWQESARGKNIRKNITVTLFKRDKTPGRVYTLVGARPVELTECDNTVPEPVQTITVKPQRIKFSGGEEATLPSIGAYDNGFSVEIIEPNGQISRDNNWELAVGGAQSHEDPPVVLGKIDPADPTLGAATEGHRTCTDITLRGAMTDKREALMTWINETVNGKPWKRMLTITELISVDGGVKDGKQYIYSDCFPVGYVFPRMSVTNTTGNVMEEVRIKPIRCELK